MNIDDLTIGQVRELQSLIGSNSQEKPNSQLTKKLVGKYVIVRSRNEGINAGEIVAIDETGVILKDARRIYYHRPKDRKTSWYEGVSVSGLSEDSKISCEVEQKAIIEDYSITVCSEKAKESIKNHKSNEQS